MLSAGPGTGRASSGTYFPATIPNRRNFVPPPSAQGLRVWREKVERASKEELVTQYNGIFKDAGVVVVTHYSGLSVPEIDDLRNQMAEVGGTVKVTKNLSLIHI